MKGRNTRQKKTVSWAVTLLLRWSHDAFAKGTSCKDHSQSGGLRDLPVLEEKKEAKREVGRIQASSSSHAVTVHKSCYYPKHLTSQKQSPLVVAIESNITEAKQAWRHDPSSGPFPGLFLKAAHLLPLGDLGNCSGHLPATATHLEHCRTGCWGRAFDPLAVRVRHFHKGKRSFWLYNQPWYAVLNVARPAQFYADFSPYFAYISPEGGDLHLTRHSCTETLFRCWSISECSNLLVTLSGESVFTVISASVSENRGNTFSLILIPLSFNVDFPFQFPFLSFQYLLNLQLQIFKR